MTKICFLTSSIYTLGGIQRIVSELANGLYNNYDITVVCWEKAKKNNQYNYKLNPNIKVKLIDNNLIYIEQIIFLPLRAIRYIIRKLGVNNKISNKLLRYDYKVFRKIKLINHFKREKYDYVLAEGLAIGIFLSRIKNQIPSKIFSCWHSSYHNYVMEYNEEDIVYSLKNTETIVLSKYDLDLIKEKYNIDVKCLYNFISSKKVVKSKLIDKNFLTVGRYDKVKGYDRLIKMFNQLDFDDWNLIMVGEGPERKKLQSLIDDLNLNDRVKLVGGTNNVKEYYQKASVFLMTSYEEGFPMVILESMKYGLPIIAFDIPVLHEILPDGNCIVKQGDYKAYIKLMKSFHDNKELRKDVGNLNAKKCMQFYDKSIIQQWRNLLK